MEEKKIYSGYAIPPRARSGRTSSSTMGEDDFPVSRSRWSRPWFLVTILSILIVTLALRLITLDTSLGYDGMATFLETQHTTPQTLLDYLTLEHLFHPGTLDKSTIANELNICFPGYYALNKAYVALFGIRTDPAVRLLPAILSFLTVAILAWTGWRVAGPHGAIAASLLGALSPLLEYYGSYIRFYAPLCFFSILAYGLTLEVVADVARGRRRLAGYAGLTLLPILMWIPLTIHAGGGLPLFVCTYITAFFIVPKLDTWKRTWLVLIYGIIAIPVLGNTLVFVFARATDTSVRSLNNVMSASLASLFASIFFNFNGLIYLTILFALVVAARSRTLRLNLLYLPVLGCLLLASAVMVVKHDLFRPDYLSALLPITYVLCADSLERITEVNGGSHTARGTAYLILSFIVLFSLPSFVSNAVIDQDRLSYGVALRDIEVLEPGKKVLLYTHSPGNFRREDTGNVYPVALEDEGRLDESGYDAVLYAIGWRREGFQKQFVVNDPEMSRVLEVSHLRKISGKPRLDLRDNLFFIFGRDPRRDGER